jgi:hypothetical protein
MSTCRPPEGPVLALTQDQIDLDRRGARYCVEDKRDWNAFVRASKNGTFLFDRDYMEYHSDRFDDHSLVVRKAPKSSLCFPPTGWAMRSTVTRG